MPQTRITFATSDERKKQLEEIAQKEELTVTDIVNRAIRLYLEQNVEGDSTQ
jgi:predicted transcriptional regulator